MFPRLSLYPKISFVYTLFIFILVLYPKQKNFFNGIENCSPAKSTYTRRDGQGKSDKQVKDRVYFRQATYTEVGHSLRPAYCVTAVRSYVNLNAALSEL